ncbi:MAG TPA: hypothetical protein VG917_01315 [Patescibacteria group bacterium]|nr:hypothetical protein [Patescibacteria group bacterium]
MAIHLESDHYNRRQFLEQAAHAAKTVGAGALLVGTGVTIGAGADRVLFNSKDTSESQRLKDLLTVRPAQVLNPTEGSVVSNTESGFFVGELRVIHTPEALNDALLRIRDEKTLRPIQYAFDPSREVVIIAALGEADRASGYSVSITQAVEKFGVMRVKSVVTIPSYDLASQNIPTEHNSPFSIARFPRVKMGNTELDYETEWVPNPVPASKIIVAK